ncbi:hypothetical protein OAM96_05375 [Candidatus Poseidoniaceae archaeon]|nr:hypothetical protein [Candidatus Poseidoniaceae archaeon]
MEALRKKGLPFTQLEIGQSLPSKDTIWFGSEEEVANAIGEGRGIACNIDCCESAVTQATILINGLSVIENISIGIDPGPRPGLAWLADGVLMGVAQLEGVDFVVDHVNSIIAAAEFKNITLRIGDGAPLLRDRIINKCLENQWNIEEVDEAKTSRGLLRHNHSTSAVRIALLRGKRVWQQRVLKPTAGQIRYIQNQSRTESSGAKTISKELAAKVGTGELTMPQALNQM